VVPRTVLEERIFGAIREKILVPDVVAYVVERAIAEVQACVSPDAPDPTKRVRLAEIDEEVAVLTRMAERSGRSAQVAQLIAGLEGERASLATQNRSGPAIDIEALRSVIEASVLEMRAAFAGDSDSRRAAFRALLGESRMRVFADPDRTFRVEGIFRLPLETRTARPPQEEAGRFKSVVAGGGFCTCPPA
jgi:hypothetical protein